jgi:hypothetical protein
LPIPHFFLPEREVTLELNGKGIVTWKLETKSPVEKVHISESLLSHSMHRRRKSRANTLTSFDFLVAGEIPLETWQETVHTLVVAFGLEISILEENSHNWTGG